MVNRWHHILHYGAIQYKIPVYKFNASSGFAVFNPRTSPMFTFKTLCFILFFRTSHTSCIYSANRPHFPLGQAMCLITVSSTECFHALSLTHLSQRTSMTVNSKLVNSYICFQKFMLAKNHRWGQLPLGMWRLRHLAS